MKRALVHLSFVVAIVLLGTVHLFAATPATTQASTDDSPEARRFTFLGDQLSADEAAIAAINKALVQAGYKAAIASDRANVAAKGNELMDRQGGAPVAWKDFYGRTARDFVMHDTDSTYHQVQRPKQFNYIYRANNNQIEAAKTEVDSIGKKVDALLARRQQLEAEQSSLWATISFESITNRDISTRLLYRNELQAGSSPGNDNLPDPASLKVVRAATAFVRALNSTVTKELGPSLESDQKASYGRVQAAVASAQATLEDAIAGASDVSSADPAQSKDATSLVSSGKRILALSKDLDDAYRKSLDADREKEEGRKLLYRGTVQESLFAFSESVAQMDDQVSKLADQWGIKPIAARRLVEPVASGFPQSIVSTTKAATPSVGLAPAHEATDGKKVDLIPLADPSAARRWWHVQGSTLVGSKATTVEFVKFRYAPPAEYDYHLHLIRKTGLECMNIGCVGGGKHFHFSIKGDNGTECSFGPVQHKLDSSNPNNPTRHVLNHETIPDQELDVIIKVRRDGMEASVNGEPVSSYKTDFSDVGRGEDATQPKTLGIGVFRAGDGVLTVKSADVVELSGEGTILH